ncbi:hypothetical protein BKA70DRAFT_1451523 [Coprinopsis sp. MPI-PUGE-AT-0042]|nr:hypothetical protein BKA70DRAFT_1451523 [Coprinopsis sp. MPI-PUGE-AT-0042]
MFWSDGTLLASFGGAKLWPCYMYFGNESKYNRSKGSQGLCEHIAYFEDLRGDFKDYLRDCGKGKAPPKSFIAFCNRLMFHAQWDILLDDELRYAMKHGIVITCYDGVQRRFYPRIFTYSTDYPEKILIATVRNGGTCACPCCTIPQCDFSNTGTEEDRLMRNTLKRNPHLQQELVRQAHGLIFDKKLAIGNKKVEAILKPSSWAPVVNTFSKNLGMEKFDIFSTLVVDLLHDFEIGVWKSLFTHLIRLLESSSTRRTGSLDAELNYRFVDQDMFMRYHWKLAIGHAAIQRHYQSTDQSPVLATPSEEEGGPNISVPPLEPELLNPGDGDSSSSESGSESSARWDDESSDCDDDGY